MSEVAQDTSAWPFPVSTMRTAIGDLVAIRITPQAKLERVERQRHRKLVHRAFERVDPRRCAWSAHVARGRKIEPREFVRILCIGALVEQPGPAGLLPVEVLVL